MVVFDLDDTLYKEQEYVWSAYHAIHAYLSDRYRDVPDVFGIMQSAFIQNRNPFDALIEQFSPWQDEESAVNNNIPDNNNALKTLLQIYRNHVPDIHLPSDTRMVLDWLKDNGYRVGIITDGRSLTQMNKIKAMGIDLYAEPADILISEDTGHDKTEDYNFRLLMSRHADEREFVYVADNPAKDFVHPNRLGWKTVMLADTKGENIHPQNIAVPDSNRAQYTIDKIEDLVTLLSGMTPTVDSTVIDSKQ